MNVQRQLPTTLTLVLVLLCVLATSAVASSTRDTIELTLTIPQPSVEQRTIDGQVFDMVTIENCPVTGQVGHPALPAKRARVVLPPDCTIEHIEVELGEPNLVGVGLRLPPIEQPFAMSAPVIETLHLDDNVYSSDRTMPESAVAHAATQVFRGQRVALITVVPMDYIPASGTLRYYPEVRVAVHCQEAPVSNLYRGLADDQAALARRVDDSRSLAAYTPAASGLSAAYDLLILAPAFLADAYIPLADYHNSHGTATEIHTLDQVGSNDPTSVRDYIRNEYMTNGIRMVLIGADDNLLPALDVFVEVILSSGSLPAYDMPGDFYFACLDGTFNYDGDSRWAEPTDGDGGGDIDLLPEVGIGRVSASTVDEVTNLVTKTIAYLESDAAYLDKVLLAGEDLGFGGLGEYGGYAIEEMVDGCTSHGMTTCGFSSATYDLDRLYDLTSMPYNYWPADQLITRINDGIHIIDHLGHSDIGYAMRTDTSMVKNQLTNTEYCFIYAEGCNAGMFDHEDCWAEYVTVKLAAGAFGCVANARVGIGSRSTKHPVHVINREFWDGVYNNDEGFSELGMAMLDARFDLAGRINEVAIRWTYYETNLFADPAVAIKSLRSLAILFEPEAPITVSPSDPTEVLLTVMGVGEGEPISSSGRLHYSIDGGPAATVPVTHVSGTEYHVEIPAIPCDSKVDYCVTFDESQGSTCFAPDSGTWHSAISVTDEVVVFEDDFEKDEGWTVSGGLWQRGVPDGGGGQEQQYPVPDPTEGCTGASVMGYNLSGDYEPNLGACHVTSPPIDCSDAYNTRVRFCRWLGVEQPGYDQASVSVSNDSLTWHTLWTNNAIIADLQWNQIEFDVSSIADFQPTVYLRWTMGPTDGYLNYCGWNIDDVRVVGRHCANWICGDLDGNGSSPNIVDLTYLVAYMFNGGPPPTVMEAGNIDGDGGINIADLTYLVTYLFSGGPAPDCG